MDVIDFFGGGFIIYVMAVIETIAICWCYGEHAARCICK